MEQQYLPRTFSGGSQKSTMVGNNGQASRPMQTLMTPRYPRDQRSGSVVLSEKIIEHEILVPKMVVREEVVLTEHIVNETQKIREKIVEISKPIIQEKIVEVPEFFYVENIIEVPEIVYQEKINEIPKIHYQDRIVEIPKIIYQEKIVEVPDIEYRDIPIQRIVEVPEIREQIVYKNVPVPQYVDKIVPEIVEVAVSQDVVRHVPIPVEAISTFEYSMPQLDPNYNGVDFNVYLPRFVEVPIPAEFMDEASIAQAEFYIQQVTVLGAQTAASLAEIEKLAGAIKASGISSVLENADHETAVKSAWKSGRVSFRQDQMARERSPSPTRRHKLHKQRSTGTKGEKSSRHRPHRSSTKD